MTTSGALPFDRMFHVGIRVTDIEVAQQELTDSLGVTWASMQVQDRPVWVPGKGHTEIAVKINYTCEGPVHLELLEGERGSIWDGNDYPGAHHFGVWSDDVHADTEALLRKGWTLELAATSPDEGYGRFTYVRSPQGFLLEPVHIAALPRFEIWWAGGELAPASSK